MNQHAAMVLQNALLIAGFFAVYWLTGTWWGWLFIFGWLYPAERKCKCEEKKKDEVSAIIRERP